MITSSGSAFPAHRHRRRFPVSYPEQDSVLRPVGLARQNWPDVTLSLDLRKAS